ncbi:subtilisin-like protein [Melanomma pulvis-pyrius CBS 109.77]|uniref:tripeptidyl-peptidase II n=1 Tax=Melanomma pulvis-pyrius CBS 109.77 TaxID=1314802 RepID=A0A6A6XW81_9PLEO|nr:subtilisin-like protein [Melanomma pulvis-pyrius CBS 109.77]
MHFLLPVFATFIAVSSALPAASQQSHVVHEKRDRAPAKWTKRSRMDPSHVLPVRVGLAQRNLDRGMEFLDSVSNPSSKDYGKHWSIEEVRKTFAPSDETRESVLQWLSQHGISSVRDEGALHTLAFDLPVADAEKLLNTKYYVYEHDESGDAHVACDSYSVPEHITKHINIVTPTLHWETKPYRHGVKRDGTFESHPIHKEFEEDAFVVTAEAESPDDGPSVQDCLGKITPSCLRALYNIPEASTTPCPNNSIAIVEYNGNSYTPEDLDTFFTTYQPAAVGARPILTSVAGGALDNTNPADFNTHGESNLDLQYAMALTFPQPMTLIQIGNDPTSDGSGEPENYIQTKVVSTSWGSNENEQTPAYMDTVCNEYMKLGLQGVSVLFSTADFGVAGNKDDCMNNRFQPNFPTTCPYVTAVGATQLDDTQTDIAGTLAAGGQPEVAINSGVKSGGGFSDHFAIPDYQNDVVQAYLTNSPPPYGPDKFNAGGRAFPDIAVNGRSYTVVTGGAEGGVDGTSASTPLFASMITMINQERLAQGRGSVGFLNPVLYSRRDDYIKDVVSGNNPGCGTDGFSAAPGWDPVTGLGTPDYQKLLAVFMSIL